MRQKLIAAATAFALAMGGLAPVAQAYEHRRDGYYDGRGGDRHYDGRRGRGDYRYDRSRRGNDDDGEAIAAGVIGLVLGLAIASSANQSRQRQQGCYDNCGPPQGYYDQGRYQGREYSDYPDRRSAYESDYGYAPDDRQQCVRTERQWDRYAGRYLMVEVPC